jgi:putative sugar O-methyltransferase
LKKIIKNINRIISRLNHDFKNYHVFSVIKSSSKKFSFKKNLQAKISNKFIDRISAYALYLKTNEPIKKNNDLWSVIENQINHKGFIDSICDTQKNNKELIKVLKDLGKTKLLWGYGTNRKSYNQLSNKKFKEDEKRFFFDYLISISEYYGNIKIFNPEQGGWLIEEVDYDDLINKIFKKRNISLFKTPNYYYGYKYNREFIFLKDLKGLYAAEQLKNIYKNNDLSEIIEIGAGIGYTCHYLKQMINTKYTIYDLPFSSILQAIYLMISHGENNVHLDNEKLPNEKLSNKRIFIKPYWKIFEHKTKKNILWFNEDSMPEIDLSLSKKYTKKILESKKSYFLSINQEARNDYGKGIKQHTVSDLLKTNSIYRTRDFLRPGYIEELFKIS